ncbi:MAG: hypothetical protein ABI342_04495 [Nitrososphaera sp.]|jgi:hypothetical protein
MEVSSDYVADYNANLFELKSFKPLKVFDYVPTIVPAPQKSAQFYQILGVVANKLSKTMETAVISDAGKIRIMERKINSDELTQAIDLENIGKFDITLALESEQNVSIDDWKQYSKLVNQIIDVGVTKFSNDYYKFSEKAPYIIERGEGYFDESLRQEIGIEDGRRFYRGLRLLRKIPCLVINREIELRSWKNLLNELKILGEQWAKKKKIEDFDFYNPPKAFVSYINWIMRGKTGTVKKYPAPPIRINEITWDSKASDKIIDGEISLVEYQRKSRGIVLDDENQPVVKWTYQDRDGNKSEQYHVPELLVVGHTFDDLSLRTYKSKISQVFDVIHPNCNDQQRKIFDFVQKIDQILRSKFSSIYPSKLEFALMPKNINEQVITPKKIVLKLNKTMELEPPYGVNFYRRYSESMTFAKPVSNTVKIVVISETTNDDFLNKLQIEFEKRNVGKMLIEQKSDLELDKIKSVDLILTISDDEEVIKKYKEEIINKKGIAHQNINMKNVQDDTIPLLVMQMTLKLGGYPWLIENAPNFQVLSIKSYTNPFNASRYYLFNIMTSEGVFTYQSKPYQREQVLVFLREIQEKIKGIEKLLVLITFDDQQIDEYVSKELSTILKEYLVLLIKTDDQIRIFTTYASTNTSTRRRRMEKASYPIEAYEFAPQGAALKMSDKEFYLVTTSSMKINTYYRGCPLPIHVTVIDNKGMFDMNEIIQYLFSLCMESGTSGNVTKLPAPLYYLGSLGYYLNQYGTPINNTSFSTIFYV